MGPDGSQARDPSPGRRSPAPRSPACPPERPGLSCSRDALSAFCLYPVTPDQPAKPGASDKWDSQEGFVIAVSQKKKKKLSSLLLPASVSPHGRGPAFCVRAEEQLGYGTCAHRKQKPPRASDTAPLRQRVMPVQTPRPQVKTLTLPVCQSENSKW